MIGKNAAGIDTQTWLAMTMLDSSRAKSVLANKTGHNVSDIKNMIIWGNHSPTMYPDIENAMIGDKSISTMVNDMDWVENTFYPKFNKEEKLLLMLGEHHQLHLQPKPL